MDTLDRIVEVCAKKHTSPREAAQAVVEECGRDEALMNELLGDAAYKAALNRVYGFRNQSRPSQPVVKPPPPIGKAQAARMALEAMEKQKRRPR